MATSATKCPVLNEQYLFPVLFSQPANLIGHELGIHLGNDCNIAQTMAESLISRKISTSHFNTGAGEIGLKLLQPLFNTADELQGYIVGIVMINQLVDSLWGDLNLSEKYQLFIFNGNAKQDKIYASKWLDNCTDDCSDKIVTNTLTANIPFANQVWQIQFSEYGSDVRSNYYAYGGALTVFFLTLMFNLYFWTNNNKVKWANNLIAQRTESLQYQAHHDELTQLLNRQALTLQLENLTCSSMKTAKMRFCLLFIDLDHFKKINDTMGHLVGDKLLQKVAKRLNSIARRDDQVFRFGGDEFVIILNNSYDKIQIQQIAKRILIQLEKVFLIDDVQYRIGASIGASIVHETDTPSSEILRNADIAMYEAKKLGRGQVVFFSADMYQDIVYRQTIENALELAINDKQLTLHLQPIESMNQLKGFEALSRWQHPERGMILPHEFIAIAEETNLIHSLGNWVIDSACKQLREWLTLYSIEQCPYISINVSPIQLSQSHITDEIIKALAYYQVPGQLLVVELTESALINNKNKVKQHLQVLRRLGVRIYLDDFGTGFSSLSLLRDFPIDVLKIDRSFIIDICEQDDESQNLVRAIISMAKALNMDVIAEGVEDLVTKNWLYSANCVTLQGYYLSKPLTKQKALDYIAQHMQKRSGQLILATVNI
jgi:diguanylate cyclase (GGDEF)-like protein